MTKREKLMTGRAWEEFCDRLKAAGQVILQNDVPSSELDRAEGFRYLTRMITAGLQTFVEYDDPDFPAFPRTPDITTKRGLENPDNIYLRAPIRGDATYRITGRRGTCTFLGFQVTAGEPGMTPTCTVSNLTSFDLEVAPDGSFEIIASAEPHAGNWLRLEPDASRILVREAFQDWDKEEAAELRIVQIGKEGRAPRPLTPSKMAKQLEQASAFVGASASFWTNFAKEFRSRLPADNFLSPPRPEDENMGMQGNQYGGGFFNLGPDEALVIEVKPPECPYWMIQLGNFWLESLDYVNHQTSLNGHQAHLNKDGVFRAVIAHQDPGAPNWLDTMGHQIGLICYRWKKAETSPWPTAKVVKFDDIWGELPADTPRISKRARQRIIERRQAHISRRYHQ
jgi:hypothetical protein